MGISFVVVFGVTYLFTDTLVQYVESERAVRALGADQVLAVTTPAARTQTTFTQENCKGIEVDSCAAFGIASVYLWPPALIRLDNRLEEDDALNQTARFLAEDAATLRITLVEGRFPNPDAAEAVVTEQALKHVRGIDPDFGPGSKLDLGFQVVGVVQTPQNADLGVFESIHRASILIHQDAPTFEDAWFLSPLGESGLALQVSSFDKLDTVKGKVRRDIRNTEFYQPAAYAQTFAASIRGSLLRLAGLFGLALLLTGVAYWHFISVTLAKRTMELSIWRLLGMNLRTLSRRLQRKLLPLPLISGLLACALGSLLLFSSYRATVAPYAFLCGLVATALLTRTLQLLDLPKRSGDADARGRYALPKGALSPPIVKLRNESKSDQTERRGRRTVTAA